LGILFLTPLEPVRQFRAPFSLVRELADEQRERLDVSGDPKRASIHRIETQVGDRPGGQTFACRCVAAKNQARSGGVTPGLECAEGYSARHGVESGDDLSLGHPLFERLHT
jgi:hypothetical protein